MNQKEQTKAIRYTIGIYNSTLSSEERIDILREIPEYRAWRRKDHSVWFFDKSSTYQAEINSLKCWKLSRLIQEFQKGYYMDISAHGTRSEAIQSIENMSHDDWPEIGGFEYLASPLSKREMDVVLNNKAVHFNHHGEIVKDGKTCFFGNYFTQKRIQELELSGFEYLGQNLMKSNEDERDWE